MKKAYFFKSVLATCMLALWGTAQAGVVSSTFTNTKLAVGSNEPTWTASIDANGFDNSLKRGVQFGKSTAPAGTFTITSDNAFTKVTSVKVTASAPGEGNTIAVKVGETAFTGEGTIASGTTNANGVYTFTGAETDGVITLTIEGKDKAVYIKTIEVECESAGGEVPGVDVAEPVFSPTEAYVANSVDVTITAEDGLTIRYTTDGTDPTTESEVYTKPITITAETEKVVKTIKAIAVDADGNKSKVVSFTYNVCVVKPMTVPEGCVGFDFIMNPWKLELGVSGGATGELSAPIVQDGASISFDKGTATNAARMWGYNAGGQLRVYKNSTFTITAPSGKKITKIEFNSNNESYSTEQGTLNGQEWTGLESSVTFAVSATVQINTILITLVNDGAVVVKAPVITPATGTYYEAQTVTITAEDGLKIYYYTGDDAAAAQEYTQPFEVTETTTITAWAEDADKNKSSEVTSVVTIATLPSYTTIAAMKEAATATKTKSAYKFENLLVTGVAGSSLYVSDGTDGFLFYGNKGVTPATKKGDKISGTIVGDLYLYNGMPEMAVDAYEGFTVASEGNEVKPTIVEISDIAGALKTYENTYIRLENVNFEAEALANKNVTLVDGNNDKITLRDNFGVLTDMVFDKTKSYNVNAFVASYNGAAQIYPLTKEDVQIITNLATPESAWEKDTLVMLSGAARDLQNKFTTTSDGAVTYSSSNEDVVTVDANGVLTWKKDGVATIYAETPETEKFLASRVSFIYAAISGDGTMEKPYSVADAQFLNGTEYLTGEKVWIKGCIVGYIDGNNMSKALFEAATEAGKSNLLLADSEDAADGAACVPVQLPAGLVRDGLQPSADNYKKVVWIHGTIEKYFGVAGVKNVTDFSKDGKEHANGIEAVLAGNAAKAIYNLNGQKMNAITKGGIYIINGKKVLVK